MVKISHIFLMALLTLGSANALFAAKSKSAVKKVGGGESTSSQQYTFGIKEPKTGGIVGGEFGIGSATAGIRIDGAYGIASYPIVPLNIFGGYQWYFYDRPHYTFGVRVRGHIGYTNYNTTFKGWYSSASLTSNSIQYGVEGQLLWDFLDYKEHTAGMHFAPLGFEIAHFFGEGKRNGTTYDLGSHTKFAFTVSIGLHYYYAINHQVSATYKYRTYSASYNYYSNARRYYSVANSVFMLGYAYKF